MVQVGNARTIIILLVLIASLSISCRNFKVDQTIPAYIHIESYNFESFYLDEGTDSHNISDVWVYVDDQLIGSFELPATVPILKNGSHKLELRPGIKVNGIADTRAWYPLYQPSVYDNLEFIEDSVINVIPTAKYYENIEFAWMEDFELGGLTFESSNDSDTIMVKTEYDDPNVFEGYYCGLIELDAERSIYEGISLHEYDLPQNGVPIFLEINFKTNNTIVIGVREQYNFEIIERPLLNLNTTEVWKKIYVNLTKTVVEATGALDFKIFIGEARLSLISLYLASSFSCEYDHLDSDISCNNLIPSLY